MVEYCNLLVSLFYCLRAWVLCLLFHPVCPWWVLVAGGHSQWLRFHLSCSLCCALMSHIVFSWVASVLGQWLVLLCLGGFLRRFLSLSLTTPIREKGGGGGHGVVTESGQGCSWCIATGVPLPIPRIPSRCRNVLLRVASPTSSHANFPLCQLEVAAFVGLVPGSPGLQ